jgi:uncharacterized protein YycO
MSLSRLKRQIVSAIGNIQIWPTPPFLSFSSTSYKFSGRLMRAYSDTIETGDVILRRYDRYLTSRLVPGYYSHAGIAVSKTKVIHAIGGEGVIEEDLLQFLRTDHACLLRPLANQAEIRKAAGFAISKLGTPYDLRFSSESDEAIYCTELILRAYEHVLPSNIPCKDKVPPDDLFYLPHFTPILSPSDPRSPSRHDL